MLKKAAAKRKQRERERGETKVEGQNFGEYKKRTTTIAAVHGKAIKSGRLVVIFVAATFNFISFSMRIVSDFLCVCTLRVCVALFVFLSSFLTVE